MGAKWSPRRQPSQPGSLAGGHRLQRRPVQRRAAGLDLAEDQGVPVAEDQVDLPELTAPVAVQEHHAAVDEVAGCVRLAERAEGARPARSSRGRSRRRSRTRPGGRRRRGADRSPDGPRVERVAQPVADEIHAEHHEEEHEAREDDEVRQVGTDRALGVGDQVPEGDVGELDARAEEGVRRAAGPLAGLFRQGRLYFTEEELVPVLKIMEAKPTIVVMYMDRPPVFPEVVDQAAAILANFGASDKAILDVLFGNHSPEGKLPFEIPSSVEAVNAQFEDVPYDSKNPLFPFGYGLTYDMRSTIIKAQE